MKFSFKRSFALILAAVMALGTAACGTTGEPVKDNTAQVSETAAAGNAEAEYVYKADFKNLMTGASTSLTPQFYTDDGFYATGYEIVGSSAPEGAEPIYYGQYDIREPRLYYISNDGTMKKLDGYTPVELPEAEEGMYNYYADSYISGMAKNAEGKIVMLENLYASWQDIENFNWETDDYSHYFYTTTNIVRVLDTDGKELSRCAWEVPNTEYYYFYSTLDDNGNLLMSKNTDDGSYFLTAVSTDGETVYEIPTEYSLNSIFRTADGTLYASLWSDTGICAAKFDTESKTFSESIPLANDAYNVFPGGGDYPLYYNSGSGFYGYDMESGEKTKLFSWIDCDINPDDVFSASVAEDGSVRTLISTFDNYAQSYSLDFAVVSKQLYDPSTAKTELTLATQYLSWEMKSAVIAFNRKSDKIRIAVKDYSEYNTDDDYTAGVTKLTTEILAGNCPDIIYLSGLPVSQMAAKGLLEDLYPYLEADSEIDTNNLFTNVLKAAENNGKLVRTVATFGISTCIGSSRVVGERNGWTYDEMYSALNEMPDGCTPFDISTTRGDILRSFLGLEMNRYVDWSTGKVDFSNEDFMALLKFAAGFPEQYSWDTYDYTTDSSDARISQGLQLLYSSTISDVDYLMYLESCFGGTPVSFIGYPTSTGEGGTVVTINDGYAMSTTCADKDAAWQFLRTFFTAQYYMNNEYSGLPIEKDILEKKLKEACTVRYEANADGTYRLDSNGEKIPEARYYAMNGGAYTYYALSADLAKQFADLIESVSGTANYDESIISIVLEQAAPYFAGQKTVEEAAKLVQSKANIYVNEQR